MCLRLKCLMMSMFVRFFFVCPSRSSLPCPSRSSFTRVPSVFVSFLMCETDGFFLCLIVSQVRMEFGDFLLHLWGSHVHSGHPNLCLSFDRVDNKTWHTQNYMRQSMACLKSGMVRLCFDFDEAEKKDGIELADRYFNEGVPLPFDYSSNPHLMAGIQEILMRCVVFFFPFIFLIVCFCRCLDRKGFASLVISRNRTIADAAQTIQAIYYLKGMIGMQGNNGKWPQIYAGFPLLLAMETSMRGYGELMGFEPRHFSKDKEDLIVVIPIRKNRRQPKKDEKGRTWFNCIPDAFGCVDYYDMLMEMMERNGGRDYQTKSFFVMITVCSFFLLC